MEFYIASGNVPFSIALGIVLLMGVLEVISLLMGGSSSLLGGSGPDAPDVPHGPDVGHADAGPLEVSHADAVHADVVHADHGAETGHDAHDAQGDVGVFGQLLSW